MVKKRTEIEEKYEAYQQHLTESIMHPPTDTSRMDYQAVCVGTLIVGILSGLYTLFIIVGYYTPRDSGIYALARSSEIYSGLVSSINALAIIVGIVGAVLTNKKKFAIMACVICVLVAIPLFGVYWRYIGPFLTHQPH